MNLFPWESVSSAALDVQLMFGPGLDIERQAARQLWWTSDDFGHLTNHTHLHKLCTKTLHVNMSLRHLYTWDRWQHFSILALFSSSPSLLVSNVYHVSNFMWTSRPSRLKQKFSLKSVFAEGWKLQTEENERTDLIGKRTAWELDKEKMMTWKTGQGGNREGPTIRPHLGKHTHSVILYFSEISHVSTVQSRLTGSWPEKFQVWTFYRCFSVWSPTKDKPHQIRNLVCLGFKTIKKWRRGREEIKFLIGENRYIEKWHDGIG